MIYTKSKLGNGVEVVNRITSNNVFTKCPACGREFPIDLNDFVGDTNVDINTLNILCADCSKKQLLRHCGKED